LKVAVVGATGFIGRHVLPALLAAGAEVVAAAREPDRLELEHARLTKVRLDIADAEGAFAALGAPDLLLHLAWGGLPNYRSDVHLQEEYPKQLAFLEACARDGLRRLVVTGTCLEYGMREGELAEDSPTTPVTAYGTAKDRLRQALQAPGVFSALRLTWLRLFYVYGPGQAPGSLYSQLRSAVESGASEFPMSPGDQQRDFLAIEDAADIIRRFATVLPAAGVVNLCSGVPQSVLSMAQARLQQWGSHLSLKPGVYPYPDYEAHAFWGDARKLHSLLEKS
jgi:nucleoside-diphosphate-sugar epimerase